MYRSIINLRSRLLVFLTHKMALPFLKLVRKPVVFPFTSEQLLQFPDATLGKDLVDYITARKLKLLPYYAKHDIKHILLGYDTTDDGEVCLQCFMLGNRHVSFPVIGTVVFGITTMPEHWKKFYTAYKRGKSCSRIEKWRWFELLHFNTRSLQQLIPS